MINFLMFLFAIVLLVKYWEIALPLVVIMALTLVFFYRKKKKNLRIWTRNNFMDLKEIRELDGFEFEEYVASQFSNLGMLVKETPKSGDYGVDLILGDIYAIQLKNYSGQVGISAIQEIYAGAAYYNKKPVALVTNYYTKPAIELAVTIGVELIDLDDIENWGNMYYARSFNHISGAFEYVKDFLIQDMGIDKINH